MKINIVDAIMGSGKTGAAINYMKDRSNDPDIKYIYITPYVDEVNRICKQCPNFKQPVSFMHDDSSKKGSSKLADLKKLLNCGWNIATTHALFHLFDDEIIDLCYSQNYVLFMDEVTEVVKSYPIEKKDLDMLKSENMIEIDDKGIIHWIYEGVYRGEFSEFKRLCDLGCLALYGKEAVVWLFPLKIFNAFRESWILTYKFEAQTQKYYYDYYGMEYNPMYVVGTHPINFYFTKIPREYQNKYNYKELITIVDDEKLNAIGDSNTALSKTWYERNKGNAAMGQLKKNLFNYFTNRKVLWTSEGFIYPSASDNLWTTFKDYKRELSGKGYTKGFLSSNARATNEWRERTVIAYTVNKYFNPFIKRFFTNKGIEVDEDAYALSEMLQFIWRSGIRDGKHITIYIPSKRMRTLLINWIEENS